MASQVFEQMLPRSGSLLGENLIVFGDFFDWVAEAGVPGRVRINSSVTNKK